MAERNAAKRRGLTRSKAQAKERAAAVMAIDAAMQDPESELGQRFWQSLGAQMNYSTLQLKDWYKSGKRKKLEDWAKWREEQNKKDRGAWKRFKSFDSGCYVAEGGRKKTNTDHFEKYFPELRQWIREEQLAGKEVSADDVLDQFREMLAEETEALEEQQEKAEQEKAAAAAAAGHGDLAAEAIVSAEAEEKEEKTPELTAAQVKRLKILQYKAQTLLKQDNSRKYRQKLLYATDFRERVPNLTLPMTPAEAELVQELTLMNFSYIVNHLATASLAELTGWVANPEKWIENREDTAWVSSDAVPVYLDISTGKILVDRLAIHQMGQRRRRKDETATHFLQRRGATEQVPLDVQGATRKDKNRLTWICRDVLTGFFKLEPEEIPAGKMLSSVLIVPCEQPCRLLDMSMEEPAVWLRTHQVVAKGKIVQREEGQPVGQLLRSWRDHRRKCPDLYQDEAGSFENAPVQIFGQQQATMDQSICVLLSDQLAKEELPRLGCKQAIVQTDCAGCEHTPLVKAVKSVNQQVDHIIGPKQTQPMQRVDLGWAKLGKDAQRESSKILRRKQRQKAYEEGVPALLVSKHTEMLLLLRDMHQACVEGAQGERQGVCQLARMGGFLDFQPTPDGLKPVEGSCWETDRLASGSSRMRTAVQEKHRAWVQQHGGKPPVPDWSRLEALRDKLKRVAEERQTEIRKARNQQTIAKTGGGRKAGNYIDIAAAAAEGQLVEQAAAPAEEPITGMLDVLPDRQGMTADETLDLDPEMEGADRHGVELNAVQMRQLEAGQHALVQCLERRELKALLGDAQAAHTSSQAPGKKAKAAKQQDQSVSLARSGWSARPGGNARPHSPPPAAARRRRGGRSRSRRPPPPAAAAAKLIFECVPPLHYGMCPKP